MLDTRRKRAWALSAAVVGFIGLLLGTDQGRHAFVYVVLHFLGLLGVSSRLY